MHHLPQGRLLQLGTVTDDGLDLHYQGNDHCLGTEVLAGWVPGTAGIPVLGGAPGQGGAQGHGGDVRYQAPIQACVATPQVSTGAAARKYEQLLVAGGEEGVGGNSNFWYWGVKSNGMGK